MSPKPQNRHQCASDDFISEWHHINLQLWQYYTQVRMQFVQLQHSVKLCRWHNVVTMLVNLPQQSIRLMLADNTLFADKILRTMGLKKSGLEEHYTNIDNTVCLRQILNQLIKICALHQFHLKSKNNHHITLLLIINLHIQHFWKAPKRSDINSPTNTFKTTQIDLKDNKFRLCTVMCLVIRMSSYKPQLKGNVCISPL